MPRVFRLLLVWFLVLAMPVKGMAALAMLGCGPAHHGAAALQVNAAHQGHQDRLAHVDHRHPSDRQRHHGHHGHHGDQRDESHARAAMEPAAHAGHAVHAHAGHAGHGAHAAVMLDGDGASASGDRAEAADRQPLTHKCSACAACGAAAALPAEPPRFVLPEAGPAAFTPLPLSAVRFVTDGPDRPPRTSLA